MKEYEYERDFNSDDPQENEFPEEFYEAHLDWFEETW